MTDRDLSPDNERAPQEVWPPPPINAPPILQGWPSFVSNRGLSLAVIILLGVGIAFDAIESALLAIHPHAATNVYGVMTLVDLAFSLAMSVCFLVWTYRSYRNLQAFRATGLHFTPGWAVGYFFIPILSLFRPYQVFKDIWRASEASLPVRGAETWQPVPIPSLILGWWLSYILAGIVGTISALSGSGTGLLITVEGLSALSAILTILVVRQITARQEEAAKTVSFVG